MILTGVGRIGKDVEVRKAGGHDVADIAIAYNYGKKDEEGKRPTTWVRASLWGDRAAKLAPYLKKGQQVSVVLEDVSIRTYDKTGGGQGVSLEARVVSVEFVGSSERKAEPAAKPEPKKSPMADFEDDIPF